MSDRSRDRSCGSLRAEENKRENSWMSRGVWREVVRSQSSAFGVFQGSAVEIVGMFAAISTSPWPPQNFRPV